MMFSLSFVGGSKFAEGGPNPLVDLNRGGPPYPLGYRHSHRSITLRYGKAPIKTHGIKKKLHSGARKVNDKVAIHLSFAFERWWGEFPCTSEGTVRQNRCNPRFLPDLKSRFPYFELYPYSKTLGYPLDF